MGYRPPAPWSMPDQDEPETWATWSGRHRPKVTLPDEPLANRPEAVSRSTWFLVIVGAAIVVAIFFGVL